jgi:protein-tyrosine phosphatase
MVAIGEIGDALDHDSLVKQGINAVLSLAPVSLDGVVEKHLQLEVADRVPLPFDIILTSLEFIKHHVQCGQRVLLHCEMGISRSPSLAVCYLHETQGLTIEAAIKHVKTVRPKAEPHPELVESIRCYYKQNPQNRQTHIVGAVKDILS